METKTPMTMVMGGGGLCSPMAENRRGWDSSLDYRPLEDLDTIYSSMVGGLEDDSPLVQEAGMHRAQVVVGMDHPDVIIAELVKQLGYPNVYGARIPVKTNWNLQLLEGLLQGYHNKEVIEFLWFGWPANRLPGPPHPLYHG